MTALSFAALVCGVGLLAQTATNERNAGITITRDSASYPTLPFELTWWARPDFYYFVLQTTDLTQEWVHHDFAIKGKPGDEGLGDIEGFRFDSSADMLFFKLTYTDDPDHPFLQADWDGDHLRNIDELDNPELFDLFEPEVFTDLNGNGFADYWETYWQGVLGVAELIAWNDADGDGYTVAMEYKLSLGLDRVDTVDADSPVKDDALTGEIVLMIPGMGARRVSEQSDSSNLF